MNWTNSAALVQRGGIMSPSGTSRQSPDVRPMATNPASLACADYKLLDVIRGQMFPPHCFVLLARRKRFWAFCRK